MINKEQIEKLNCLIGALICHGKEELDKDFVEDNIVAYKIEDFLYSLDNDFRKYIDIKYLYKESDKKNIVNHKCFEKTTNEYKSDIEVRLDTKKEISKCSICACSDCPAVYDTWCPKKNNSESLNCRFCIDGKEGGRNQNYKKECDKKINAIEDWNNEISYFDVGATSIKDECIKERKKINFRRALRAWHEVTNYIDSDYGYDEMAYGKDLIHPYRYWCWTSSCSRAIEYGLWGLIDYFDIYDYKDENWLWYKNMQTYLMRRQEGDIMPHQHFSLYIFEILKSKSKIESIEKLKPILLKIKEESNIISHWNLNKIYNAKITNDENKDEMPCSIEYYEKIKILTNDFVKYIKEIMNINNFDELLAFIGLNDGKYCGIQVQ